MDNQHQKCGLCENSIPNFHPLLNHLKIDKGHEYNVCKSCFDKIVDWQREVFSTLFPRKNLKKR